MKISAFCFILLAFLNTSAMAYGPPNPLKDIGITFEMEKSSSGLFTYHYKVSNPKSNNGNIYMINILLGQDPEADIKGDLKSLPQCSGYAESLSESIFKNWPVTATGSMAPQKWVCGYGALGAFTEASFGWGSGDLTMIKPGERLDGFALISYGLPEIRSIDVEPYVEVNDLPDEYEGNTEKTLALLASVRWIGKTVGPKSPPKDFIAKEFLSHIISLKDQAAQLGWIKGSKLMKKLEDHFDKAQKALNKNKVKKVKSELEKVISLTKKKKGKSGEMTEEAQALLKYNIEYFLENLQENHHKGHHKHHDKDHGKHHGRGHNKYHHQDRNSQGHNDNHDRHNHWKAKGSHKYKFKAGTKNYKKHPTHSHDKEQAWNIKIH